MNTPIVSFLIPTFNRSRYCISLIRSIAMIPGKFEIIISDNSSDLLLKKFISENKIDERIKYYFTNESLDMTSNLNRAISYSTGYYICFIGDDDIFLPKTIFYLELFKKNKIDIISPEITINYCWPDFSSKYFKNKHKSRLYYRYSTPYFTLQKSNESFLNSHKKCFQGTENMPKLYHGFVKREIFVKIKEYCGDYLFGSTPDMSASVLISLFSEYYYKTNIPLTIPGASGGSNTGRAATNKHVGKLENESQTKNFLKTWDSKIPKVFSVETVWAHSGLLSVQKSNFRAEEFNYLKLYALIIVNNTSLILYVLKFYLSKNKNIFNILKFLKNILIEILNISLRFLLRALIPTPSGGKKYLSDINDLESVIQNLKKVKNIKNFNVSLNQFLIEKVSISK